MAYDDRLVSWNEQTVVQKESMYEKEDDCKNYKHGYGGYAYSFTAWISRWNQSLC